MQPGEFRRVVAKDDKRDAHDNDASFCNWTSMMLTASVTTVLPDESLVSVIIPLLRITMN
jgi:hypothetical protein